MRTYTFHVSLSDNSRVWRKIELPAEVTLETLHFSIQHAYDFGADHLYSFFMSGKAWDESTEYTLPDDGWDQPLLFNGEAEDEDIEDEGIEEDAENDILISATGLPPGLPQGIEPPTPEQLRSMMQILQSDPQTRAQFMQAMSEQLGMPMPMVNLLISNMEGALQGMSDEQMNSILQMGDPFGDDNAFRISISSADENIREGLTRIQKVVGDYMAAK